MEEFGKDIKGAVQEAAKDPNPEQALKTLKARISSFVDAAYDKLDRLSPYVLEGSEGSELLDEAQTDIIHISEGLSSTFDFFSAAVSAKPVEKERIDVSRLSDLTKSFTVEELDRRINANNRNGSAH